METHSHNKKVERSCVPMKIKTRGLTVSRRILRQLSVLITLCLACFANADGVNLAGIQDQLDLERYVQQSQFSQSESLSDALAIPESDWSRLPKSSRSLGRDHGPTWFRFKIDTVGSDIEHPLFLMLDYPHYDYIDVYLVQNNTLVDSFFTGDQRGFDSRPVNQRTYLFPLKSLQADAPAEVYFRINTPGPLLIPFSLVTSEQGAINDRNVSLGLGVYFGILLIMFAYNAFILGALRDSAYFYYLTYMAAVAIHQATLQGLGFQYLWPDSGLISNNYAVALSSALMQGTAVVFVVRFIRLYDNYGLFERIAGTTLLVYSWLLVAGSPFMDYSSFLTVVNVTGAISVVAGLYIGVVGWYKNVPYARLFAAAWFVYLIFIGWYLLELASILPASRLGEHILAIGSALELALLSIAFADRINHERDLRLRSQSKLMDVQIAMNAELEEKVRMRTTELEEANRRLAILSTTDGLTGLLNRRRFDEMYEQAYLEACRNNAPLAVLMIDIDHFKHLNDEYGHRFGDICLIEAGRLIKNAIDDPDAICARYGGEEFVVILPNANSDQARQKAESLRRAFEGHVIKDQTVQKVMTVSIGLTVEQPVDREAWEKLLQAADTLLYTAKRNGRNQVAFIKQAVC